MLFTVELTPGQKYEMEQALREKVERLRRNAQDCSDPRLGDLIRKRAETVAQALMELKDAEVA